MPGTIDFATSFYFHREGRGLLLGMSDPDQEPGFHLDYSEDWLPRLGDAMEARAPRLLGSLGATSAAPDIVAVPGVRPGGIGRFAKPRSGPPRRLR